MVRSQLFAPFLIYSLVGGASLAAQTNHVSVAQAPDKDHAVLALKQHWHNVDLRFGGEPPSENIQGFEAGRIWVYSPTYINAQGLAYFLTTVEDVTDSTNSKLHIGQTTILYHHVFHDSYVEVKFADIVSIQIIKSKEAADWEVGLYDRGGKRALYYYTKELPGRRADQEAMRRAEDIAQTFLALCPNATIVKSS
jgi:hypothetical protein